MISMESSDDGDSKSLFEGVVMNACLLLIVGPGDVATKEDSPDKSITDDSPL